MGHAITCLVMLLTVLGDSEARHIVAKEQSIRSPTRSPTRTRLVVVRGTGNERKLVLLNDPGVMPLPNGRQLDVNVTKTENDINRASIEKSETSRVSDSLIGNNKILSPEVDLSSRRRLRIGSSITDQPLSNVPSTSLSSGLPPVKVSGKAVDGVEINAQGSFGDINIPEGIEVALNRLRGENWQYREVNEHNNHVYVDNVTTVKKHNTKPDSTDVMALKSSASRDASVVEVAAKAFGLQTMPAFRPQDVKRTHASGVHSREDKRTVGPDGNIGRFFDPQISNNLRHQSSGGEKLNITDAVPLSISGISPSKGLRLSAPSSLVSATYRNTDNNTESHLTITSTSVALNSSDSVGLQNATVKVEPTSQEVLKAGPYSSHTNTNGEVPDTLIKSLPGASAVRLSSSSSSMRSTKVIQKAVQKTTISKTRVISTKQNTNSGAIFASGSDSMAVAVNASAVISTKRPHLAGSIEVQKQPNGKTKIILKDANNNPIVLQATGPVEIQRIVTPDGKIKFIVNPIRQTTTEETELEAEEVFATTTAVAEETEVPAVEPLTQSTPIPVTDSVLSTTNIISLTTLANNVISTVVKTTSKSSVNELSMKQNRNKLTGKSEVSRQVTQAMDTHSSESSTTAIS